MESNIQILRGEVVWDAEQDKFRIRLLSDNYFL